MCISVSAVKGHMRNPINHQLERPCGSVQGLIISASLAGCAAVRLGVLNGAEII